MKNKIKYIGIILLLLLITVVIIFFTGRNKNNQKINAEVGNVIKITEPKNDLPVDTDFRDNKELFGSWNSVRTEIYVDNRVDTILADTNRFMIMFSKNDLVDICTIEEDLKCSSMQYSYIDHILYLEYNYTYLNTGKEVLFKGKYLIIKSMIDASNNKYSLLYFEKSKSV